MHQSFDEDYTQFFVMYFFVIYYCFVICSFYFVCCICYVDISVSVFVLYCICTIACKSTYLSKKQRLALRCMTNSVCRTSSKLYKDGLVYHSMCGSWDGTLRWDSVCIFQVNNSVHFGLIESFITLTEESPTALVYKLHFENG